MMNARDAEQRVGDDVKRDEQAVVPDHRRVRLRPARARALRSRRRIARGRSARRGGGCAPRSKRRSIARGDGVGERLGGRFVDEHAGFAGDDGFERAAAAERDDRPAARLRFERHDAEVFFARQQHDRRAAVEVADLLVGHAGRETRRRRRRAARARARSGPSPTISAARRRARAGVDGEVDALVGNERRHDQREALGSRARPGERSPCRRADTRQWPRDYSIGRSCPQHNER